MAWVFVACIASASAETDYESAHRLVLRQKWAEALPMLKKLHSEAPSSALIGEDLAGALLRANQREEALRLYRRYGLREQAEVAATAFLAQENYKQYQEGVTMLKTKRYAPACEKFERTLEKEAAHRDILLRLVQCESLTGSPGPALLYADTLEKIHGLSAEAGFWKGYALAASGVDRRPEALPFLQNAVKQLPTSENAPLALAEAFSSSGQKAAAIATLEADLKKNPLHVQSMLLLARLRFAQAKKRSDFQDVRTLLELAQSRLKRYEGEEAAHFEKEDGVDLRDPEQTKRGMDLLFQRNEEKLLQPAS